MRGWPSARRRGSLDSCTVSHPIALRLLESSTGDLWVATSGGLNRLDRTTGCFQRYYHQPGVARSLPDNQVVDLVEDEQGAVIILTAAGAARYFPAGDDFELLDTGAGPWHRLLSYQGRLLAIGPNGLSSLETPSSPLISFAMGPVGTVNTVLGAGDSLLIGTSQGLYVWPRTDSLIRQLYNTNHLLNRTSIIDILPGNAHGLQGYWVATRGNGLGFLDLPSGEGGLYEASLPRDFNLLDNHVRALAQDRLGSLWIGTYIGLNRFNIGAGQPSYFRSTENDGQDDQVLELHADNDGGLFAYRRWRGLYRSQRIGKIAQQLSFPLNDFLEDKDLNQIYTDRQGITWLLRGNDALYRYDGAAGGPVPAIQDSTLSDRRLNGIHQDLENDNQYWLATSKGLGRLHLDEQRLEWWAPSDYVKVLSGDVIATLLPSVDGKIWLSAGNYYNDCLGYFDPATQQFHFFDYRPGDPSRIAGGRIKQFAEDTNGTIWVAASEGLLTIDPTTNTPRLLTQVGEVPVGVLEAVLTDDQGGVWFSGDDQIGHYVPTEDRLTKITCTPIRQFGNAVATKLPDGRLLFGGLGGMVALKPWEADNNAGSFPRIVLNELRVGSKNRPTEQPLADLETLSLEATERNISLRFAGLFFDRTRHIEYAYRLNEGEWQELGSDRSLSFTNLRPATYRLEIRSTDGQSNWNPEVRKLAIKVAPFWYETAIARAAFLLFGLTFLLLLGRFFVRRRLERQAHEQLLELDAFKSQLFTDLTHEFRTPLTLILGPAKRLREKAKINQDETLGREARRISHQGRRLLRLINQLLDLRKLEAGQLQVDRV
ncbi:MAG: two-component regulator propeller domain-containing protein, partial [Bacteroidota bacterium]